MFPIASDLCDANVENIVKVEGLFVPSAGCEQAGTYTNTWTVADDCGNTSAVFTQVITIEDNTEPTWTTAAGDLDRTLECSDAAGIEAAQDLFPIASDLCDANVENIVKVEGLFVPSAGCEQAGTYTNTWTVADDCGNTSAVFTQVITIEDNTEPAWTTAAGDLDRTLECSDAAGIEAAQDLFPIASDLCDANVENIVKVEGLFVPSAGCEQAGTYTNTWTVADDCGNTSAVFTQVITIEDNTEPAWTTAAGDLDRTLECSDAAGIEAAQDLFPIASDLCDANVENIVKVEGLFVPSAGCEQAGTYTNTWTVADDCGNTSAVFTQVITIEDNTEPTWTTAAGDLDRTLECSDAAGIEAAQDLFPIASDLCDANVENIVKVEGLFVPSAGCEQAGTYTNTWTVADDCGNTSAVFTQVITIEDNTEPTWTTAAGDLDRTLECSDAAGIEAAQDLFPIASDLCDANVENIVKVEGLFVPSAGCEQAGTYTNTWTVADDCGNTSAVFTQVITIEDNTEPTWTTAAGDLDRTLECSDAAGIEAAQDLFPIASDLCDANVENIVKVEGLFVPSAGCEQAGTYTNTWTVADDCGNTSAVFTQVITIEDNTEPAWTTAAGDLDRTLECSDAAGIEAAQDLFPIASDLCDANVENIVKVEGLFVPSAGCEQAGTYTNTWTVADDCGNTSAVFTQVITIEDNTEPTWTTAAGDLDRTLECSDAAGIEAAQDLFPIASDLCDANVENIVKVEGLFVPSAGCEQAGTYTNTWTVADDCGNTSAVFTQVITIEDNTEPAWTTAAGDLDRTLECSDAAGIEAAQDLFPIASDLCDANVENIVKVEGLFVPSAGCEQAGTYTNTWTVADDCGNTSAVFTQVITIEDNTEPTWTTAAGDLDRTLECSDAAGIEAAQDLFPIASDLCDANVENIVKVEGLFVPSAGCEQAGTYTNTWTVADDCGNTSAVFTQVITIEDNTEPTWTTAAGDLDRTLECSDAAGIEAAQDLFPIASDLCDANVENIVKVEGLFVPSAGCEQAGTYTNTWTVADDCGNTSAVFTQVITIEDNTEPAWTTAAGDLDRTLECSDAAGIEAAQDLFPIASDLCDANVENIVKVEGLFVPSAGCEQAGTYTNTWTVADDCGNTSAVFTQVITIEDNTEPTWTTAAGDLDRTLECSDAAGIEAAQDLFPIASDLCDANVENIVKVEGLFVPSAGCEQAGTYTNTWTVADDCGNTSAVFTQVITIEDNTEPAWTTAAGDLDRTLECSDAAGIEAAQDLFPIASDLCDANVENIVKVEGLFVPSAGCEQAGTYTNTWTVADDCGNTSAVFTQVITIEDNTEPTWTTAAGDLDRTLECSDAAGIEAAQDLFPIASDLCDANVENIVKVEGLFVPSAGCEQAGTYTNTWTVADDCGNTSAVFTQVITIEDNTEPTWTTAAGDLDRTLECSDAAGIEAAQDLFPIASDLCDANVENIVKVEGLFVPSAGCEQAGTYTNTWTVADDCGNTSAVFTQVITIEDNTEPAWTTAAGDLDRTLECSDAAGIEAAQDLFPIASDLCDANVENIVKVEGLFVPSAGCEQAGTYTNTWTVADDCGNTSAVFTQVITIEDNTEPTAICKNITTELDENGNASIADDAVNNGSYDNCSSTLNFSTDITSFDCSDVGDNLIVLTVTDECENTATCTATVTIEDNIPPVFMSIPTDQVAEAVPDNCLAQVIWTLPEVSDNCGIASLDCDHFVTNIGAVVIALLPVGENEIIYTVTDVHGHSVSTSFTVTVNDITPPVITGCPSDITVNVEPETCGSHVLWNAPTVDDGCVGTTVISNHLSGEVFPVGTTPVTYTATDASGNVTSCNFNVIVIDNEAPTIVCSDNIQVCSDIAANITVTEPEVDDNCGIEPNSLEGVRSDGLALTDPYPIDVTTITWTVTDIHSNTNTCMQTVTVNPLPAAITGSDRTICYGENTTIGDEAVPGNTYSWTSVPTGFTSTEANPTVNPLVTTTYTVVETTEEGCSNTNSITVTVNPEIVISETHFDVKCHNGNDGWIDLTVVGGTEPYVFAWTGTGVNVDEEDQSNLSAGMYTVIVTDAIGCQLAPLSIEITQPEELQASATYDPILCKDETTTIHVTATGGTPPYVGIGDYTNTQAGDYDIMVIDHNGCSVNVTGNISEPNSLLVLLDVHTNVLCHGEGSGEIQVSVLGGTEPYTYLWTGPDDYTSDMEDISGLNTGDYNLTVTDLNGCSATLPTVTITEPAELILTATPTQPACNGDLGSVLLSAEGGTGNYTFGGDATENLGAGTYNYTVTDANGCSATASATIIAAPQLLILTATPTQPACNGELGSVLLSAEGGTGNYTFGGDATENLGAGTYNYTVTDANGCSATASATIIAAPQLLVLTATPTQPGCNGDLGSVQLSAEGGTGNYTFGGDATENLGVGTYSYTVTDANGCSATASATIIAAPQLLILTATPTQPACNGDLGSVHLSAEGGTGNYTFGGDATENLGAGTYNYTVTDANGCSATASATIIAAPQLLILTATPTQPACNGDLGSVLLSAEGGTGNYTFGGDAIENLGAGTYSYTVTDANGCSATASATIIAAPQLLVLTATPTQPGCNGDLGSVQLSAEGGTGNYTFGGDATENLGVATYNYTVTDANGCSATATVTINPAPSELVASATADDIQCNGGTTTITVSATGGTAPYSGTGSYTEGVGTYTYTVTDHNGCSSTVSVTISEPDELVVNATEGSIACNGETTTVTVSASGGTEPYSGTGEFTVSAGAYSFTVSDGNGCTKIVSGSISQPAAITATATAGTITVNGGTTTLVVTATGGTEPYSYSLNGAEYQVDNTFIVTAGTYTVTVKDANECIQNTNTITITEPEEGDTPTILYYIGTRSAQYNSTVTLSAILFNRNNFRGIRGRTITFTIGSQSVTAETNYSGIATATLLITQEPGNYRIITSFAGDATYKSSFDDDGFTITGRTIYAGLTGMAEKEFDGNSVAYLTPDNYTLAGIAQGDDVYLNYPETGSYNNRNVGTGKRVTVNGLTLNGTDANKYKLSSYTLSANIGTIYSQNKSTDITTTIESVPEYVDMKVYPNPFTEKLRFEFMSPVSVNARIELYDMAGRLVKIIFEQEIEGGVRYDTEFIPESEISGIYVYRITLGKHITNGKAIFKKQ